MVSRGAEKQERVRAVAASVCVLRGRCVVFPFHGAVTRRSDPAGFCSRRCSQASALSVHRPLSLSHASPFPSRDVGFMVSWLNYKPGGFNPLSLWTATDPMKCSCQCAGDGVMIQMPHLTSGLTRLRVQLSLLHIAARGNTLRFVPLARKQSSAPAFVVAGFQSCPFPVRTSPLWTALSEGTLNTVHLDLSQGSGRMFPY